jgi:hypothetical protein
MRWLLLKNRFLGFAPGTKEVRRDALLTGRQAVPALLWIR